MIDTLSFSLQPSVGQAVMCCVCLAMLLVTTGWHYEVLRGLGVVLPRGPTGGRGRMPVVLLGIFVAHALEVLAYAGAYYLLARTAGNGTLGGSVAPSFNASLYFSFETYSSLGYGDIVPTGALRLLAGGEALNGLLLIGWSACYAHAVLGPFPDQGEKPTTSPAAKSRNPGAGTGLSTTSRPAERRCSRRRAR